MTRLTLSRYCFIALGAGIAVAMLLGLAEGYLRLFPPKDLYPYLGEDSPLQDIYKADCEFGATYANWETFYRENAQKLNKHPEICSDNPPKKIWAFFGNSFVHAKGMLADQTRAKVKDRLIFNLGRNTPLSIRFAQVRLLLEKGMKPERIIMSFMPVDTLVIGEFPLKTLHVTSRGAMTHQPRSPDGPAGWAVQISRVFLTGWIRAEMHRGNFDYSRRHRHRAINPVLLADLRHLFGNLAQTAKKHEAPVTIVLVPEYRQVVRGGGFAFQDDVARLLGELDYDILDPRQAFVSHPNPRALYLPDRHLTPEGNQILLKELLSHLQTAPAMNVSTKLKAD